MSFLSPCFSPEPQILGSHGLPDTSPWTSPRLLPWTGSHTGLSVSKRILFSWTAISESGIESERMKLLFHMVIRCLMLNCFSEWLHHFTFLASNGCDPVSPHSCHCLIVLPLKNFFGILLSM